MHVKSPSPAPLQKDWLNFCAVLYNREDFKKAANNSDYCILDDKDIYEKININEKQNFMENKYYEKLNLTFSLKTKKDLFYFSHILMKAMGIFLKYPKEEKYFLSYNNKLYSLSEEYLKNENNNIFSPFITLKEYYFIEKNGIQSFLFTESSSDMMFILSILKINIKNIINNNEINNKFKNFKFIKYFLNFIKIEYKNFYNKQNNKASYNNTHRQEIKQENFCLFLNVLNFHHKIMFDNFESKLLDIFKAIIRKICFFPYLDHFYDLLKHNTVYKMEYCVSHFFSVSAIETFNIDSFQESCKEYIPYLGDVQKQKWNKNIEKICQYQNIALNVFLQSIYSNIELLINNRSIFKRQKIFQKHNEMLNFLEILNFIKIKDLTSIVLNYDTIINDNKKIFIGKKSEKLYALGGSLGISFVVSTFLFGKRLASHIFNQNDPYDRFKDLLFSSNKDGKLYDAIFALYAKDMQVRDRLILDKLKYAHFLSKIKKICHSV